MAEQVIRWVTPVAADRLQDPHFKHVLKEIDADPGGNPYLPFARLPMVHFASLTVFEDEKPPLLVFESNIDGSLFDYVWQLVNVGRKGLDVLYHDHGDYPPPGIADIAAVHFFLGLKAETNLYHIGHPNRTVQEIRGDVELRRSIAHALDTDPKLKKMLRECSCADLIREIQKRTHVPKSWFWQCHRAWHSDWDGPTPNAPTPLNKIKWKRDTLSWPWWLVRAAMLILIAWTIGTALVVVLNPLIAPRILILLEAGFVFSLIRGGSGQATIVRSAVLAVFFGVLVWVPFWFPTVLALIPALRPWAWAALVVPGVMLLTIIFMIVKLMVSDPTPVPPKVTARVPELLEAEDRYEKNSHYNHVAGLSEIKPAARWLRSARTRLGLKLLNLFYRTEYVKGKLVNIPSIHFAQWSVVNNRYVLFVTNYDGPADSYLDDFFNNLAFGVAFIWQDTRIFPMSIDPRRLKMWVREGQTLASARYRAAVYEGLTVGAINNNTFIRKRLLRGRTEESARRWLRRFATTPEEPGYIAYFVKWTKELVGVRS